MATEEVDAEWVPNGEEPAPPYDPGPVDGEIVGEQYNDEQLLEGLDKVPPRGDILAGLEEFRDPFAQTRRRELAATLWPEFEGEIWTGVWETPSPMMSILIRVKSRTESDGQTKPGAQFTSKLQMTRNAPFLSKPKTTQILLSTVSSNVMKRFSTTPTMKTP